MSKFITPNEFSSGLTTEPIDRWAALLVLVLQGLELEAFELDEYHPEAFELELQRLQDAIADRLKNHKW